MSPRLARRLRSAAPVILLCVLISMSWDRVSHTVAPEPGSGPKPLLAIFIGVLIALPLIVLDTTAFAERMRRFRFLAAVLIKAATYAGVLTGIFLGVAFFSGVILAILNRGWVEGYTLPDFVDSLPGLFTQIAATFSLYVVIIFFRSLDRLLGPGILFRYLTGRYHHPRRERRIFMFLDLKGSTGLSERLSLEAYYGLVNDFFRDVSTPVLDSRGEIYEYVGDEVVITWKHELGIRDANCVRAFFEIEKTVWEHSDRYLARYGVVPEFKAGLHSGEVIAAEMGDLKKEIAFNGEVLNVAARIQGQCNGLGRRLLASRTLVDALELPADVKAESVGLVPLRGAEAPAELMALA